MKNKEENHPKSQKVINKLNTKYKKQTFQKNRWPKPFPLKAHLFSVKAAAPPEPPPGPTLGRPGGALGETFGTHEVHGRHLGLDGVCVFFKFFFIFFLK